MFHDPDFMRGRHASAHNPFGFSEHLNQSWQAGLIHIKGKVDGVNVESIEGRVPEGRALGITGGAISDDPGDLFFPYDVSIQRVTDAGLDLCYVVCRGHRSEERRVGKEWERRRCRWIW